MIDWKHLYHEYGNLLQIRYHLVVYDLIPKLPFYYSEIEMIHRGMKIFFLRSQESKYHVDFALSIKKGVQKFWRIHLKYTLYHLLINICLRLYIKL